MGKLVCRCGFVFDLTPSPEAHLWIAVKDADLEPFLSAEAEAERLAADDERHRDRIAQLDRLASEMKSLIYNCPECNRVIWFRGEVSACEVFTPES